MKSFKVLAIAAVLVIPAFNLMAATKNADAKQVVTAAIAIAKVSDLDFGTAVQGDALKIVAPASGAEFTVTGEPGEVYTITLPIADVTMVTAGGGANKEIIVNDFVSNPAVGANGLLTGGTQTLKVGATRAAIGTAQVTGSYVAPFTVEVAY